MPEPAALASRLAAIVGEEWVATAPAETAPYAVDGVVPGLVVKPGSQDEVAKVLAACTAGGASVVPWGGGSSMGTGNRPSRLDAVVLLARLDRVVEFDAANLCITVEAGMRLEKLQELAAAHKELLPIDPPGDGRVTMGGLVAADLSGPSRLLYGTSRDWVLGLRVALPDGQRIRCGGKVIKNVSGYDMNKLFIRSHGTLGIVTEVTVKLLPAPAQRAGVAGLFPDLPSAKAAVKKVLESFLLPEALDLLDPAAVGLAARALGVDAPAGSFAVVAAVAGSRETVERQVRDLTALFAGCGGSATALPEERSVAAWAQVRNVLSLVGTAGARVAVKVAVPLGRSADAVAAAAGLGKQAPGGAVVAHAGSGVVRAAFPVASGAEAALSDALEALRRDVVVMKGSLVLLEAPPAVKSRVDAWGKPGPGIEQMRRLKAEFDPRGTCSPGRFLGGI